MGELQRAGRGAEIAGRGQLRGLWPWRETPLVPGYQIFWNLRSPPGSSERPLVQRRGAALCANRCAAQRRGAAEVGRSAEIRRRALPGFRGLPSAPGERGQAACLAGLPVAAGCAAGGGARAPALAIHDGSQSGPVGTGPWSCSRMWSRPLAQCHLVFVPILQLKHFWAVMS